MLCGGEYVERSICLFAADWISLEQRDIAVGELAAEPGVDPYMARGEEKPVTRIARDS